jgi:Ca2+-binding EF-hand superfamily protein
MRGSAEEKLQWIFELYDVSHRGYITKSDLAKVGLSWKQSQDKMDKFLQRATKNW